MYMVDTFSTSARSIMDREPFPHYQTEPIAGEFYKHPYGGIARDISVSRAGFMRFFETDELGMKLVYHPDYFGKVLDRFYDKGEAIGYRGHHRGIEHWTITIIDRTNAALQKFLDQKMREQLAAEAKAEQELAKIEAARPKNQYKFYPSTNWS